jgi:hypothetical protein
MKEKGHFEALVVDGWIISKGDLKKYDWRVWSRFIWLIKEKSEGFVCTMRVR